MTAITGAGLAAAHAALQAHRGQPLFFQGYHRAGGQVGTRNFAALVATVICSATVMRHAARNCGSRGR